MTLKQYLAIMTVGTVICWLTWLVLIFSVSPQDAGITGKAFFYLSLALAIIGTYSVLGFLIKRSIIKDDNAVFRHVKKTFRHALLLSVYLISLLILQSQELLSWWNGLILLLIIVILESAYFSRQKNTNNYVK